MSSSKTEHLQLHRWDLADGFHTEELNENFARLDAAAGEKPYVMGTYQGTGGYGAGTPCRLELGFRPSLLMVWQMNAGGLWCQSSFVACSLENRTYLNGGYSDVGYMNTLVWTETGVSWYSNTSYGTQLNDSRYKYCYVAFR